MKKINPLISIVVTTYNKEKYIAECIESILLQKVDAVEIIVVDDNSSDNTKAILKGYLKANDTPCFRLIEAEHGGASKARNIGISAAKGEYISFVDGDDMLSPISVSKWIETLESDKSIEMLIFGFRNIFDDDNNKFVEQHIPEICFEDTYSFANYYIKNANLLLYGASNKVYKTDLLRDENILFKNQVSYGEDRLFNFEYLRHCGKIQTISECLYYCRKHSVGSITEHFRPHEIESRLMLHRAKISCLADLSKNASSSALKNYELDDRNAVIVSSIEHLIKYRNSLPKETYLDEIECIMSAVENLS